MKLTDANGRVLMEVTGAHDSPGGRRFYSATVARIHNPGVITLRDRSAVEIARRARRLCVAFPDARFTGALPQPEEN